MTPAELLAVEEGICIQCGGDDVECMEDCTLHKCISCGHTLISFQVCPPSTDIESDICCYGEECVD